MKLANFYSSGFLTEIVIMLLFRLVCITVLCVHAGWTFSVMRMKL